MAFTAFSRAASFSRGATESSRSRNTMSAARPWAFCIIFSLEAGTARQGRRGGGEGGLGQESAEAPPRPREKIGGPPPDRPVRRRGRPRGGIYRGVPPRRRPPLG